MNMENPYLIPQPSVISFSGGRTSGYMLKHIIDAYDGKLPDNIAVVFANTGMERLETLDFIHNCQIQWNVPIHWIEYDWDEYKRTKVVDYETASRKGEPFESLIQRIGYLPNAGMRFCTSYLKRDRINSYARHFLNMKKWHDAIGLRADEPNRVNRMKALKCGMKSGRTPLLPLHYANVTHEIVKNFWKNQSFDLSIESDAGNCTLCMLKGKRKLVKLIRENPSLTDWWIKQEESVRHRLNSKGEKTTSMKTFRTKETYKELKEFALSNNALPDTETSESIDCFCTD